MKDSWIQTHSGRRVSLPIPSPEQILIEDISWSLAMKCRFNGQCRAFYSIAEHCIRVSWLLPAELQLAGLLHDANEAYLPDIPRPVKELIPQYKQLEDLMDNAINEKYGVKLTNCDHTIIKIADNVMLATEARDFMGDTSLWGLTEIPMKKKICPMSSAFAEREFMRRFYTLI